MKALLIVIYSDIENNLNWLIGGERERIGVRGQLGGKEEIKFDFDSVQEAQVDI